MNKIAQDTNLAHAFHKLENKLDESTDSSFDTSSRVNQDSTYEDFDQNDEEFNRELNKARDFSVQNEGDDSDLFKKKPGFFLKKILPNLHNLYGLSSVFSFIATPLGVIPGTKKAGDILQRVGYCIDTLSHQTRGIFSGEEKLNLGMMVPTATAFLGTVAFENKSFWGQLTRNLGNLVHLGILKEAMQFAREFPDTLPEGSQGPLEEVHEKYGKVSKGLLQDFLSDCKIAMELTKQSFSNPKIFEAVKDSLTGKKVQNIPHMQAVSSVLLASIGGASILAKVLGGEKLAWKLNKSLAIIPTFANVIKSRSYQTMKDANLVKAGKLGEIASWGTLASAFLNFKFEDLALAMRSFFMGVNTMGLRKEAEKLFKNVAEEMMNRRKDVSLNSSIM